MSFSFGQRGLWIPIAVLFSKNPAYPRLLAVLPFVYLLIFTALSAIALQLRPFIKPAITRAVLIVLPIAWNLNAYASYNLAAASNPRREDLIARWILARHSIPNYKFIWIEGHGKDMRLSLPWPNCQDAYQYLIGGNQQFEFVDPREVLDGKNPVPATGSFGVLIPGELWEKTKEQFQAWAPGVEGRVYLSGKPEEFVTLEKR